MKFLLSIFVLLLVSIPCLAGGDVGNGGMGLLCGEKIYIVEEHALLKQGRKLEDIESLEELNLLIQKKIKNNTTLFKNIRHAQEIIGHFNNWNRKIISRSYDSYIFSSPLDLENNESCSLIQLAVQNQGKVDAAVDYFDLLSIKQKLVLYLHEVAYYVGFHYYGHTNSFLVRELVQEIISSDVKKVNKSSQDRFVKDFQSKPSEYLRALEEKGWFKKQYYELQNSFNLSELSLFHCPEFFSLDYNGDQGVAFNLVFERGLGAASFWGPYSIKSKGYSVEGFNVNFDEVFVYDIGNTKTKNPFSKRYHQIKMNKAKDTLIFFQRSGMKEDRRLILFKKVESQYVLYFYQTEDTFEALATGFNLERWSQKALKRGQVCTFDTNPKGGVRSLLRDFYNGELESSL